MMCHRMGRAPISTSGLGLTTVSSARRVPRPPARITTRMRTPRPRRLPHAPYGSTRTRVRERDCVAVAVHARVACPAGAAARRAGLGLLALFLDELIPGTALADLGAQSPRHRLGRVREGLAQAREALADAPFLLV